MTAIVLTFSRGAFLAMIVVLVMMFFRRPPRPMAIIVTIIIGVLILQSLPTSYSERFSTILSIFEEDESYLTDISFRGRTSEMLTAWYMYLDYPLLGVGPNNYNQEYQTYARDIGLDFRRTDRSAHSLYLEIAAETGTLGFLSFVALLIGCLWSLYSAHIWFKSAYMHNYASMCTAFAIGIIGYFVAALFLHNSYPRFMWFYFGIAITVPSIARRTYWQQIKPKVILE
jgi:O-antigen ligase